MKLFCFTDLNYSILSVVSVLIKCVKPALKCNSFVKRLFFFSRNKQEGFFKDAYFFSE